MQYQIDVALPVTAAEAWALITDLPAWPSWTPTVEALKADTERPQLGTRVLLKQPGRAPARYQVDLVENGRRFRWGSQRVGVRQSADHLVTATGDNSCTVTLIFGMTGPVGYMLGRLGARKIRSMVDAEGRGLQNALRAKGRAARRGDESS